ncbi:MAG: GNAT family N-acetyltransferase [Promethearchaeota archaeon]
MKIEYRTYKIGDETQLSQLFNICFHDSGIGFLRTPKSVLWRYINRPGGKADEIQIAIDTDNSKIVGSIFCPIEDLIFNNQHFKTGSINDVAVLPNYRKLGIAKKLLDRTIEFMKKENCTLSSLIADPKGHARSHLYQPYGWQDIIKIDVWINLNLLLLRYFPVIFPATPTILFDYFYHRYNVKKIEKRLLKSGISTKIIHPTQKNIRNKKIEKILRNLFNTNSEKQFSGFIKFSQDLWEHFRSNSITKGLSPTYVILNNGKEIIGFVSFLRQWMYLDKYGFRFPLGIVREFTLDRSSFTNSKDIQLAYSLLIEKTIEASNQRGCSALMLSISSQNKILKSFLQNNGFLKISGGVLMYKTIEESSQKKLSKIISNIKPIQPDLGEIWLYP